MNEDQPKQDTADVAAQLSDAERKYANAQLECRLCDSRVVTAQLELRMAEIRRTEAGNRLWMLQDTQQSKTHA